MRRRHLWLGVPRAIIYALLAVTLIVPMFRSVVQAAGGIALRATQSGNNGRGSTSLTVPVPTGIQVGDVLIAQVVVNTASTVITAPSGWNIIQNTKSSSTVEESTYFKIASVTEPASYTWAFGTSEPATGGVSDYAGVNTATPVDASSGKFNANSSTVSFAQITTTMASDMILAFVGVAGNTTLTSPVGFTESYDVNDAAASGGRTAEVSQMVQATAGLTAIGNGNEDTLAATNLTQLVALKPSSTGPTSTPTFAATATATQAATATATSAPGQQTPTPTPGMATATPSATPTLADITVVAVGDMECQTSSCQGVGTTQLVSHINPTVLLPLGDLVFYSPYSNYVSYYDPSWGVFRAISHPALGNHDSSGTGYYDYWNGIGVQTGPAGTPGSGWYSFNIGGWHFVSLNSNCVANDLKISCQPGSAEINWLNADLAANTAVCTIAFMHHPYYTSGTTQYPELQTIFQTLYNYKVELYLAGHTHYYQRFYPQDANGNLDLANGVTEIVAGTGGGTLANEISTASYQNEAVQIAKTYGVLKLVLHAGSYDFQFIPVAGSTATDSGSGTCR